MDYIFAILMHVHLSPLNFNCTTDTSHIFGESHSIRMYGQLPTYLGMAPGSPEAD